MSYSLDLYFQPPLERTRVLRYFAARRHFRAAKDDVVYGHPDTGVYFFIRLRCARDILLRRTVVSAEFEINYNRPSFFGIEAEKELAELAIAFQPQIEDPQMYGMGEGPYSGGAFLKAWNFGNLFFARTRLAKELDQNIVSMPEDVLHNAWSWNYHRAERSRFNHRCFVPAIMFFRIEGQPRRVVTWGQGMPTLLPRVDYVLIGRVVSGEPRFGLASWSEVLKVVQSAGLSTAQDPIKLDYAVVPPPIAHWVDNIPLIDIDALQRQRLATHQIVDDEVIAAARESIERDQGDLTVMTIRNDRHRSGPAENP